MALAGGAPLRSGIRTRSRTWFPRLMTRAGDGAALGIRVLASVMSEEDGSPFGNPRISARTYAMTGPVMLARQRDLPGAIEPFREAVRLSPDNPGARQLLEQAEAELGQTRIP